MPSHVERLARASGGLSNADIGHGKVGARYLLNDDSSIDGRASHVLFVSVAQDDIGERDGQDGGVGQVAGQVELHGK